MHTLSLLQLSPSSFSFSLAGVEPTPSSRREDSDGLKPKYGLGHTNSLGDGPLTSFGP